MYTYRGNNTKTKITKFIDKRSLPKKRLAGSVRWFASKAHKRKKVTKGAFGNKNKKKQNNT